MLTKKTPQKKPISIKDLELIYVTSVMKGNADAWILISQYHPDYETVADQASKYFETVSFNQIPFFPEVLYQGFDQGYPYPRIKEFKEFANGELFDNCDNFWNPSKKITTQTKNPKTTKGLILVNLKGQYAQAWTLMKNSDKRLLELEKQGKNYNLSIKIFEIPSFPEFIFQKNERIEKRDYATFLKNYSYFFQEIKEREAEERGKERIKKALKLKGEIYFNLLANYYRVNGLEGTSAYDRIRILEKDAKGRGGIKAYIKELEGKRTFRSRKINFLDPSFFTLKGYDHIDRDLKLYFKLLLKDLKANGIPNESPEERIIFLNKKAERKGGIKNYIQELDSKKAFWEKK